MKKGGKLHIGGYSKPLLAFTDRNGVDGFVPSLVLFETAWDGFGLYVTGREDEAIADEDEGRYDIVIRSRDEDNSTSTLKSRGTVTSTTFNLGNDPCNAYAYKVTVGLDLQQLCKTSSTRISNAQSTVTKPLDP